ncbi:RES family NAD+ phosphorylase [Amycolatopsis sp. NPDC051102]|uniref:RES family NAD+ phosphorylase n=1 Tax=Amycolatopsis sp. NPDC051102 TaxID=3155163 RepID=UPI00343E3424
MTRGRLVPDPPHDLRRRLNITTWSPLDSMVRCHNSKYGGNKFNPGSGEGGRFNWFNDENGCRVPVLYAADCYAGAIAETVLRNVPLTGRRTLLRKYYLGRCVTKLKLDSSVVLRLAEFHDPGLLRLGLRPRQLTEAISCHYGRTVKWAEAVHQQVREAQGLVWMSGRFNTARALVLFGDRVDSANLHVVPGSVEAVDSGPGLQRLIKLTMEADITIVKPGRRPAR